MEERYSSPSGAGRGSAAKRFLCNSQPKICTFVKLFLKNFALKSGAPALGGALDFAHPADPTATPQSSASTRAVVVLRHFVGGG